MDVLCLSCFRALLSPAGQELTSLLSFVVFNCVCQCSILYPGSNAVVYTNMTLV